jgi:SM-20-related protein
VVGDSGIEAQPLLCPHRILPAAFDDTFASRLLSYAIDNEQRFEASQLKRVGEGVVDPATRISRFLSDLGTLKHDIRLRLLELAPVLMKQLGMTPFAVARAEVEMVAHGDGAFYRPHVDTSFQDPDDDTVRLVSVVYYFHVEPRRYSGGALRLHAMGSDGTSGRYVDIEPQHNVLVSFPSWALHEVLPVRCPSRSFADSRFAINCWLLRKKR